MKSFVKFLSNKNIEDYNQSYDSVFYNEKKNDTPCSTRTNTPDIDEEENHSIKNHYIIQKNVKDTPEGFVYSNGSLEWINKKPHYVVIMEGYFYYDYPIKIYYELFSNFDVKIGFYNNNEFIELQIIS